MKTFKMLKKMLKKLTKMPAPQEVIFNQVPTQVQKVEMRSSTCMVRQQMKTYKPDADTESEAPLDRVDNQDAGTEIASGSKKQKQGIAGRKEIQKIRSQMPSLSSSDEHVEIVSGQKRKAAPNQKHEYLRLHNVTPTFSHLIIF